MAVDTLTPNVFDSAHTDWTATAGNHLVAVQTQGDAKSIAESHNHGVDGHFDFTATSDAYVWADVTDIRLKLRMQTAAIDENYIVAALVATNSWNETFWNTLEATSQTISSGNLAAVGKFTSIADLDAVTAAFTAHINAVGSVLIDYAYFEVTYTVAGNAVPNKMHIYMTQRNHVAD